MKRSKPLKERILDSIIITNEGCWEWQKYRSPMGYGRMGIGSRSDGTRRLILVHRASYEEWIGPIPDGLGLDHLCRNPSCCNPQHLEPVTHRTNIKRQPRCSPTHCPAGHPYSGENLRISKTKQTKLCAICLKEARVKWQSSKPHGMRYRYESGCRCKDCRSAHAEYRRSQRQKKSAATKGTSSR